MLIFFFFLFMDTSSPESYTYRPTLSLHDALPISSCNAPFAAIADDERRFYGVQFHPEVIHTPSGAALLRNFTHHVAGLAGDWTMAAFKGQAIERRSEEHTSELQSLMRISYAVF